MRERDRRVDAEDQLTPAESYAWRRWDGHLPLPRRKRNKRKKRRLPRTSSLPRAARTWETGHSSTRPLPVSSCSVSVAWCTADTCSCVSLGGFWNYSRFATARWERCLRSILSCLRLLGILWEMTPASHSTCNACVVQQWMLLTRQSTELVAPQSVSRRPQRSTRNWILSLILPMLGSTAETCGFTGR